MAFLLYRTDGDFLVKTGLTFSLAGYNLIYRMWESRGKPTDQGWHITRDDLALAHGRSDQPERSNRFVIDFDPKSKRRIGLIELLDIYVYTVAALESGKAAWSCMMLRLRDVLYEEVKDGVSAEEKERRIARIPEPDANQDFVEFLYLNGSDSGWNWGVNGKTNAAFIQGPARNYFREFF